MSSRLRICLRMLFLIAQVFQNCVARDCRYKSTIARSNRDCCTGLSRGNGWLGVTPLPVPFSCHAEDMQSSYGAHIGPWRSETMLHSPTCNNLGNSSGVAITSACAMQCSLKKLFMALPMGFPRGFQRRQTCVWQRCAYINMMVTFICA